MRVMLLDSRISGTEELLGYFSRDKDINMVSVIKKPELFLENVKNEQPDAVFIRLGCTEFSGLNTAERIRNAGSEAMIVLLSEDRNLALHAFDAGANGFITCPVSKNKIFKCVDYLKKRKAIKNEWRSDSYATQ